MRGEIRQYQIIIVNCFNDPLGKRSDETATKRDLIRKLSQQPQLEHVTLAYDGDRLLFSLGEIATVPDIQPKSGFIRPSNKESKATAQQRSDIASMESDHTTKSFQIRGDNYRQYKIMIRPVNFVSKYMDQFLHVAMNWSLYMDHQHQSDIIINKSSVYTAQPSSIGRANPSYKGHFSPAKKFHEGSFQTFKLTSGAHKMIINIDVSYYITSWYGSLLEYIGLMTNEDIRQITSGRMPDSFWDNVSRDVSGLKFYCVHSTRPHKMSGICVPLTARKHQFEHAKRMMSMEEYFRYRYNINLRYPDLPVVYVTDKKGKENEKVSYFPIELVKD